MIECTVCNKRFNPNDCEQLFKVEQCAPCRLTKQHKNAIVADENTLWVKSLKGARFWNYSKNYPLLPCDVGFKSQKKYYFNCSKCKQSYSSSPGNLMRLQRFECEQCSFKSKGRTNSQNFKKSIAELPELLLQWDYERNEVSPNKVAHQSNQKYYWLCHKGHSTLASVDNRFKGKKCGICSFKYFTSRGEQELQNFIAEYYDNVKNNYRKLIYPYEVDAYLPNYAIAFEYNGEYFHSEATIRDKHGLSAHDYHQMKVDLCKAKGVTLLFIWEKDWYDNNAKIKEYILTAINYNSYDESLLKTCLETK